MGHFPSFVDVQHLCSRARGRFRLSFQAASVVCWHLRGSCRTTICNATDRRNQVNFQLITRCKHTIDFINRLIRLEEKVLSSPGPMNNIRRCHTLTEGRAILTRNASEPDAFSTSRSNPCASVFNRTPDLKKRSTPMLANDQIEDRSSFVPTNLPLFLAV